jgi:hypothetical protein
VIYRYGVAEEALMRYNPSGDYEAIGREYRVGTFFAANGRAYRVNGAVEDDQLVIFINLEKPNLDPGELSGHRFHLKLNAAGTGWEVVP